jgi:hypothetical protein
MADSTTLIEVSAFSGLAGALLTQMITGTFAFFADRRKYRNEARNLYRAKKAEIGENFFYMTGEKMAVIKKNIDHWKNWNDSRSEASLEFLNKELARLNAYIEKLDAENWKFNLIGLYFDVALSHDEVIEANGRSQQRYLKFLDISHKIRNAAEAEKEGLYGDYALALFDMCAQYEDLYNKMSRDMQAVRAALLRDLA